MRLEGWANHLLHDRRYADYFADRLARAYVGMEDGPLIAYRKRRYIAWLSDELHKNALLRRDRPADDRGAGPEHRSARP